MKGLEKLTNLKSLGLMNNQFTHIEGLENYMESLVKVFKGVAGKFVNLYCG